MLQEPEKDPPNDMEEALNEDVDIIGHAPLLQPVHPEALKQQRIDTWPDAGMQLRQTEAGTVYTRVKATGVPNAIGAKIPITTGLNIGAWEKYLVEDSDQQLLSFIRYGFPSSYQGPPAPQVNIDNHQSANQYA